MFLVSCLRNHCPYQCHKAFPLCFLPFGVNFSLWCMIRAQFYSFACRYQSLHFPIGIILVPLAKITWPFLQGFISGFLMLFYWSTYMFLYYYLTVFDYCCFVQLTLGLHSFELHGSTYMQVFFIIIQLTLHTPRFHIRGLSQPWVEDRIFSPQLGVFRAILYMALEHMWILVSIGCTRTSTPQIQRDNCK